VLAVVIDDLEPVGEIARQRSGKRCAAALAQPRLGVDRIDQPAERIAEWQIAEIVQPGPRRRLIEQIVRRNRLHSLSPANIDARAISRARWLAMAGPA